MQFDKDTQTTQVHKHLSVFDLSMMRFSKTIEHNVFDFVQLSPSTQIV